MIIDSHVLDDLSAQVPIHRHLASSEMVAILRGKICWRFYDDAGNETERVVLDADGELRCGSDCILES